MFALSSRAVSCGVSTWIGEDSRKISCFGGTFAHLRTSHRVDITHGSTDQALLTRQTLHSKSTTVKRLQVNNVSSSGCFPLPDDIMQCLSKAIDENI